MDLLNEIRADLVNESVALTNTLRKAKILASQIGLPEFQKWVACELSGYPDKTTVPSYRIYRPANLGTFSGPFHSEMRNVPLPTYNLPPEIKDFAEKMILDDGVGQLAAQASGDYVVKWSPEMVLVVREKVTMSGGMVLVDAHQPMPAAVIVGILDQVKNKLLDFVLGLQASNITSDDLDKHAVKPEVVRNLFQVTVYGDSNIIATGENVDQRTTTVQEGDIDSLLDFLREFHIPNDDLSALKDAISSEHNAPNRSYGPRVQAWLGGMVSKAASEALGLGVTTISKVLTEALSRYYGC